MKNLISFQTARHPTLAFLPLLLLAVLGPNPGMLSAQDRTRTKVEAAPAAAAETAVQFLGHLGKDEIDAAFGLWDSKPANEPLKARLAKMAAKLKKAGGIKKIDIGKCETRRTKKFEEVTGEKIDVVPMEIICGDESLVLAVFSIRQKGGAYRIFQLESLKEWGGTASLDDELPYSN